MKRLVLWHGWGMCPGIWDNLFNDWAPTVQADAPALPGYRNTAALADCSLETMVDALLENQPTPFALCGWSLGGMAAMLAAAKYPEKISHLILVSTTPSFVQRPDWLTAVDANHLTKLTEAVRRDSKSALKKFISMINQKDIHSSRIACELTATSLASTQPSVDVLNAGLRLLRQTDLRLLAPTIRQPTLIIHGAHDPLMPISTAQWLEAHIPNAHLEIFAEAAHAPHLSDPQRFAALASNFIHA